LGFLRGQTIPPDLKLFGEFQQMNELTNELETNQNFLLNGILNEIDSSSFLVLPSGDMFYDIPVFE